MPTLDWIGKKAVVNHHRDVPFHLLEEVPELSFGDKNSGNILVQGDNLTALKALLPYYAGKVKCIYIDPPYNTGNENWVYNDNSNDPQIKEWLGKTVGKEAEDLSRHDKWLCMMYPRLTLLRQFLREDGILFVNLDDNESSNCKLLLDEIFGSTNCLAVIAWEKRYTRSNNAKLFYSLKDTLLVYRKSPEVSFLREPRTQKSDSIYKNPDNDSRGVWTSASYVNPATQKQRPNLVYPIINPYTRKEINHPTHAWKFELAEHQRHVKENLLWWGKNGDAKFPRLKIFPKQENAGLVPVDIWKHEDSGTTDEGGNELKEIFGSAIFDNPKPTKLIERIIKLSSCPGDIILDSFAGSGTTGHAVLNMSGESSRHFILIELDDKIATQITAERIKYVIKKNSSNNGFRYYRLGKPLFDESGRVYKGITFSKLARHVFFTETGHPLETEHCDSALIGTYNNTAVYLLFNGILKDKKPDSGNVLTCKVLSMLPEHDGPKVIYGTACRLSPVKLRDANIVFKQIPYEIKVD